MKRGRKGEGVTGRGKAVAAPRRATAEDVAARAGVSIHTVRSVFCRPGRMAKDTCARVLAAAEELGYGPNVSARALSTGRTRMAGLVFGARNIAAPFVNSTITAFYRGMTAAGLDATISLLPEDVSPRVWLRKLVTIGRCDALAVHLGLLTPEDYHAFATLDVPVVLLFVPPTPAARHAGFHVVGFDYAAGTEQAVRHLAALGHKRIAYIGGPPPWPDTALREKGFRTGMRHCALPVVESLVIPGSMQEGQSHGAEALHHLFSLPGAHPTAVVCANDSLARGVLRCARYWKKDVPAHLSVTGFDNDEWTEFHAPALTTVRFDGAAAGEAAARILAQCYAAAPDNPEVVTLPTVLLIRESTGPAPT